MVSSNELASKFEPWYTLGRGRELLRYIQTSFELFEYQANRQICESHDQVLPQLDSKVLSISQQSQTVGPQMGH